jgi:hypothetical protein
MKLDYMDDVRILDEVDCTQISHLQCETQVFNYMDDNHFPHSFIMLNFVQFAQLYGQIPHYFTLR